MEVASRRPSASPVARARRPAAAVSLNMGVAGGYLMMMSSARRLRDAFDITVPLTVPSHIPAEVPSQAHRAAILSSKSRERLLVTIVTGYCAESG